MGRILLEADRESKVIASVCHGPAALLAARDENDHRPFVGRKMTSLTDEEEIEFGTAHNVPWLLADTLRKSGTAFEQGPNWSTHVVKGQLTHRPEPPILCRLGRSGDRIAAGTLNWEAALLLSGFRDRLNELFRLDGNTDDA